MHIPSNLVTTTHGSTASKGFEDVPEHFIDAMVTAAAALHDVRVHGANSRHGSIYIVKPKMHGPEEARLANALMERVEQVCACKCGRLIMRVHPLPALPVRALLQVLSLPKNTIKIGVMDEERRTSANLAQTMHAVKVLPHQSSSTSSWSGPSPGKQSHTMCFCQDRLFFVNTGFLDRTADEIHTSMQASESTSVVERLCTL